MSGRSPALCKIYSLGRDSPGNVKCRVDLYKVGFRDVPSAREGGGTAELSICITLKLRRMLLI